MTDQTENTNQDDNQAEGAASQLDILKQRARLMGITFSNNIGIDALRAKINAKMEGEAKAEASTENEDQDAANTALDSAPVAPALGATAGRKLSKREQMFKEQMALVRVRITNLDPKKRDLPGEVFTVANRVLGTVRKFIPYGEATDNGYHIPRILYNELQSRRFLHIKSKTNKQTGQISVETKWVKEFSLELLPILSEEELKRMAAAQIAAGTVEPLGELV